MTSLVKAEVLGLDKWQIEDCLLGVYLKDLWKDKDWVCLDTYFFCFDGPLLRNKILSVFCQLWVLQIKSVGRLDDGERFFDFP